MIKQVSLTNSQKEDWTQNITMWNGAKKRGKFTPAEEIKTGIMEQAGNNMNSILVSVTKCSSLITQMELFSYDHQDLIIF